jgi:hypothetical protein
MTLRTQVAPYGLVGDFADLPPPARIPQAYTFTAVDTNQLFVLVIDPVTQVRSWLLVGSGTSVPTDELLMSAGGSTQNPVGTPQELDTRPFDLSLHALAVPVTFRAVLYSSQTSGPTTANVKLFNVTLGVFVEIGGPGITVLTSPATATPTIVSSVDIRSAVGMSAGLALYQTLLYTSSDLEIASLGSADMVVG